MNSRIASSKRITAITLPIILIVSCIWQTCPAFAQSAKKKAVPAKPSLDLLVARVENYWNLLLERKKAKAAEYVVASERESFMDRSVPRFTDPKIKSLEPNADRTEAKVTVIVKRQLPFGIMDWPVPAKWIYKNTGWYCLPETEEVLGSSPERRTTRAEREESLKFELNKILRFEQATLDFGLVQRGTPVSVMLKYSLDGQEALPVKIIPSIRELTVKGLSNGTLLPGKNQTLTVTMPTHKFEGTLLENIALAVKRENIEIPFKFPVQGFVYVPVSVTPKILRLNPAEGIQEKEILVRNNSRSVLEIRSYSPQGGAIEVEGIPVSVPPGQQLALKVRQGRDAANPDTTETLAIAFAEPIEGIGSVGISVVLNASDKRDGQIYDPAKDPNLQRQMRINVPAFPKP